MRRSTPKGGEIPQNEEKRPKMRRNAPNRGETSQNEEKSPKMRRNNPKTKRNIPK